MLTLIHVVVKEDPAGGDERAKTEQKRNKDPDTGARLAEAAVWIHRFASNLIVGDRVDPWKQTKRVFFEYENT